MTKEALKQMVEALKACNRSDLKEVNEAIQAGKQAIAELENQEPVAHCEAGPNYCWKCLEESKPTYGSEEIKKLREVNKNLIKNIEELKKEPPPFWPVVQHLLDEYGLQFIDVVAAYREATQQEQEPIAWIERGVDSDNFDPDSVTFKKPTTSTDGWEWVALAPIQK
jgi:hypothetical protein